MKTRIKLNTLDVKKNKEIAEKGHKVDEKISRNSHLIFDRDAVLHKLFWEDPC